MRHILNDATLRATSRSKRLFLFVVFVVFLELSFLFETQFLDHPALLGIGNVFERRLELELS